MREITRQIARNIKYDIKQLKYIKHADDINCYLDVPAKEHRVNIFNYQPQKNGYKMPQNMPYNLGDYLGGVIIGQLLKNRDISIDKDIPQKKHLFAVGSNILGGENIGNYQNATIWGSGCLVSPSKRAAFFQKISHRHLDIRAVRGPLTRDVLQGLGHDCPERYGDPAILMPIIYTPKEAKKRKYLVIPQFYSEIKFRESHPNEYMVSMNTNDYRSVIDEIVSSEVVYTSSLHGIILAEAYGVPAVFFRGLGKSIDFKYKDYYYSTGRYDIPMPDTFEEALSIEPPALPELTKLQQGLLESFPYDLWGSEKE